MSKTPKFLVVHFNGDFLEHAAFAATAQETEEISCSFRNGADHFDMRCIPIETAAAAPALLEACQNIEANLTGTDCFAERVKDSLNRARAAIAKATE